MKIRIATRRSALALAQTRMIASQLMALNPGLEVIEVSMVTEGDRVQDRSLAAIGGKGLFIKELEAALIENRADLAVHSMKDLPADLAEGLVLACVPERESPWDLLVTRDGRALAELAHGAKVGTSSLRRQIQLHRARPDLAIEMLRGNVDTRLRKLNEGLYDAIVLAEAGVRRLGLTEVKAQRLDRELVPSIGQGALALECRSEDATTRTIVRGLNHETTETETRAERAVLRALGGSCVVPIGAIAKLERNELSLRGFFAETDGSTAVGSDFRGPAQNPELVGEGLARELRQRLADSQR